VRDPVAFPSPVLAVGALHSVTRCIEADRGTVLCMAGFDRLVGLAGAYDSSFQARPPARPPAPAPPALASPEGRAAGRSCFSLLAASAPPDSERAAPPPRRAVTPARSHRQGPVRSCVLACLLPCPPVCSPPSTTRFGSGRAPQLQPRLARWYILHPIFIHVFLHVHILPTA